MLHEWIIVELGWPNFEGVCKGRVWGSSKGLFSLTVACSVRAVQGFPLRARRQLTCLRFSNANTPAHVANATVLILCLTCPPLLRDGCTVDRTAMDRTHTQ